MAQNALPRLIVVTWPGRLSRWHVPDGGELAQHARTGVRGVVQSMVIRAVWCVAKIGAWLTVVGGNRVDDDQLWRQAGVGLLGMEALQPAVTAQRKAVVGDGAAMPLGHQRRHIPRDFARGVADRLDRPTKRDGGFRVPCDGGFVPGAVVATDLYIRRAGVCAGEVEAQFGAADRGIDRQDGQIELNQGQMAVGCADPDEATAKSLVRAAALDPRVLADRELDSHRRSRLRRRRCVDRSGWRQQPQQDTDGNDECRYRVS